MMREGDLLISFHCLFTECWFEWRQLSDLDTEWLIWATCSSSSDCSSCSSSASSSFWSLSSSSYYSSSSLGSPAWSTASLTSEECMTSNWSARDLESYKNVKTDLNLMYLFIFLRWRFLFLFAYLLIVLKYLGLFSWRGLLASLTDENLRENFSGRAFVRSCSHTAWIQTVAHNNT